MFAPFEIDPEGLETHAAFQQLKSLRKHDAMRVIKTWVNSWATSSRYHESVRLPCLFGCPDGLDSQSHYAMCPILFFLTAKSIKVSKWPIERIGLSMPSITSLKSVACVFSAYHAVKRSTFVISLQVPTTLENDQCLITHRLFAESLWAEANEAALAPVRFRPCMNSVMHSRGESGGSDQLMVMNEPHVGPAQDVI